MTTPDSIEIMAPAGSYDSLMAAIQAGADAVYFGAGKLNMRARSSQNFTPEDLENIASICRENGVKSYLTLNTIVYDEEMDQIRVMADTAKKAGISAIIASDISVMEYAREIGMPVHVSTQCNITNLQAVRFYSRYAEVMVLARELRLEQVAAISRGIREQSLTGPGGRPIRLEMFVHGALCMAVSGKCYLSLDTLNHSANRGSCLQLCRRSYIVTDKEDGHEYEVDNAYIMSPKDLCTIGFLDKILDAGVSVLKIEGRGRPPDYVKTVTSCYREAVQSIREGNYSKEMVDAWTSRLAEVFNRGFWDGYYLGRTMGEWADRYGSQASRKKVFIGTVSNYFSKLEVAEIRLSSQFAQQGDLLMITGPTTGVMEFNARELHVENQSVKRAEKGMPFSVKVPGLVRRGDKVFRVDVVEEKF